MQPAAPRQNENEAIAALRALDVLDSAPEAAFDALARAAALACGTPIALVSLVDTDRQWFKANVGLPGIRETPRTEAFCAHAVLGDGLFEVPDTLLDPRFVVNPLVLGYPRIRFYAGVPIRLTDGERVGTICVIDHEPRRLDGGERQVLTQLAIATAAALEGRRATRELRAADRAVEQAAAALVMQQEIHRVTLRSIGDAVITTDLQGHVTWLNPVAETLTGWPREEVLGRQVSEVVALAEDAASPTILRSRSGIDYSIEASRSPIRTDAGVAVGSVLVLRDITAQRRLSAESRYLATHDTLTGLVNRFAFETQLGEVLQLAHSDGSEHSLLFIDLDDFRRVNDAGGHGAGDLALQRVAQLLAPFVRSTDTLARLGGDDFAIILRHCCAEQGMKVATQVCERLDLFRFDDGERRFRVGASIGLVPVDRRWNAIAAVLHAADSACRAATEEGGNRVRAWFDSDKAIHARQTEMQWATKIENALDEDRFVLFAQRITPLEGCGEGIHAEILLRMVEPDGSLVPPGLFLPAAERFHLAQRIDRWVLGQTIAWLQRCPSRHLVETLSVNLSGNSVSDHAFHDWANDALIGAGAELRAKLCLEITETAAVTNMADATVFVQRVRAAGVRVALDDFGAGAASFGYLKALPVDYLKIDGQFVRTLLIDPLDDVAVRCFVDVARVMSMKTVAEFVDQPAVLARLREMGVDFAQGFLLHKPEPLEALLASTADELRTALALASRGKVRPAATSRRTGLAASQLQARSPYDDAACEVKELIQSLVERVGPGAGILGKDSPDAHQISVASIPANR